MEKGTNANYNIDSSEITAVPLVSLNSSEHSLFSSDINESKENVALLSSTSPLAMTSSTSLSTIISNDNNTNILSSSMAHAGTFSVGLNILKTILGAALLGIPFAISKVGLVFGFVFLIVAGISSAFGIYLFSVAGSAVGRSASMTSIALITYPRYKWLFELVIVIKCIGVGIAYLTVIANGMSSAVVAMSEDGHGWYSDRKFCLSLLMLICGGLSCLKRIDALKYSSFLGLMSIFYLGILSIVFYYTLTDVDVNATVSGTNQINYFVPFSFQSLKSYSTFVFAYTCHQNVFPIQNEAINNSSSYISKIGTFCVLLAGIVYGCFGFLSVFTTFPNSRVLPNILDSYPQKYVSVIIARLLYVFLLVFSFPLQVFPCRNSIIAILPINPKSQLRYKKFIFWITTAAILLFTYTIAMINPTLDLMLSLVGATASTFIIYVFPAMFFYKITAKESKTKTIAIQRHLCIGMISFGIVTMIAALIGIIGVAAGKE